MSEERDELVEALRECGTPEYQAAAVRRWLAEGPLRPAARTERYTDELIDERRAEAGIVDDAA
jgi:hypothetical protein